MTWGMAVRVGGGLRWRGLNGIGRTGRAEGWGRRGGGRERGMKNERWG
jgi:hypothetical protein